MDSWTFLTNHSHVLLTIARDPEIRLRDVASQVGITERAAQRIVSELLKEGFLEVIREGRRNRYKISASLPFRHPLERNHTVQEMLDLFTDDAQAEKRPASN